MGKLWRRIDMSARMTSSGNGVVRAALEDDFHHFRVEVHAAHGKVDKVRGDALRNPNTLCPSAADQLQDLLGAELSPYSYSVLRQTDARQQCTHMIDLAGLAIAAGSRGDTNRTYMAEVVDAGNGKPRQASLFRNEQLCLEWSFLGRDKGDIIAAPEDMAGLPLGRGFTNWASTLDDPEASEAALVLRRAIFISHGRKYDLDAPGNQRGPIGGCWAWQPERADQAERVIGSTYDFTDRSEDLLAESLNWLNFEEERAD